MSDGAPPEIEPAGAGTSGAALPPGAGARAPESPAGAAAGKGVSDMLTRFMGRFNNPNPKANFSEVASNYITAKAKKLDMGAAFWLPTGFYEIFVFVLFIIVLTITLILLHYGEVQRKVSNSRCALQSTSYSTGIYQLQAVDENNNKLFHIEYNLDAKLFNIECGCTSGQTVNNFNSIPIYNLRTQQASKIDKICNCDNAYDSLTNHTYYNGDPGLVRFMNTGDTSFFTQSQS
jgi:hypothetical protein